MKLLAGGEVYPRVLKAHEQRHFQFRFILRNAEEIITNTDEELLLRLARAVPKTDLYARFAKQLGREIARCGLHILNTYKVIRKFSEADKRACKALCGSTPPPLVDWKPTVEKKLRAVALAAELLGFDDASAMAGEREELEDGLTWPRAAVEHPQKAAFTVVCLLSQAVVNLAADDERYAAFHQLSKWIEKREQVLAS
jgi:hypothetical protein